MKKIRTLSYADAINEALHQLIGHDPSVCLIGQGITSPWYVGSTCNNLVEKFGAERIFDTPISESAVTGMGVGAALAGMRPVVVHPRLDFMYYALDPIINQAANWYYMFGENLSVPITVWGIINRGGEQGAQHSQAIHSLFAHIPGLKVVMPSTPYDAKGLLIASVYDDNPVIYIDDRWLYSYTGEVPEEKYSVPIGKGVVRRKGSDITIIALSYLVQESLIAAELLEREGIEVEVIDPLTLKPLDQEIIINSVKKTGKAIIVDGGWKSFGAASEICAIIAESEIVHTLTSPVVRLTLPDVPAPASQVLEKGYYIRHKEIYETVKQTLRKL